MYRDENPKDAMVIVRFISSLVLSASLLVLIGHDSWGQMGGDSKPHVSWSMCLVK